MKLVRSVTAGVLSIGIFSAAAGDATVNLTGTIKDSLTHKGIANATVALKSNPSITATTGADGGYTLSGAATSISAAGTYQAFKSPVVSAGAINFSIAGKNQQVTIGVYRIDGVRVATLLDKKLEPGSYRIDPATAGLPDQLYCIRMHLGAQSYFFKYLRTDVTHRMLCGIPDKNGKITQTVPQILGKSQSASTVDTIVVTAPRHKTLLAPIGEYSGTANFTVLSSVRQALANVVSVSSKAINAGGLTKSLAMKAFLEPTVNPGFINSGAPDSLRVRLKRIILKGDTALHLGTAIWEGDKQFTLTGKGTLDVGDMVLDSFPLWQVKSVELWFNDTATIWGSFTGIFNTDTTGTKFQGETKTYYTKWAYSYDALTHAGGADSTVGRSKVFETAPAESSVVRLAGNSNGIAMVSTVDTFTYDTTMAQPAMTILFDLNRMLRFNDGCRLTETSQVDPNNKAYFFCHSVFLNSIASFFGKPGQIQGYQSLYNVTNRNEGVPGWMTLIWKSSGELLSGILIGDDDNALVISKGRITSMTKPDSTYSFHYDGSNVDMVGFKKCTNLGDSTIGWWNQTVPMGNNQPFSGGAKFTLRFKTN